MIAQLSRDGIIFSSLKLSKHKILIVSSLGGDVMFSKSFISAFRSFSILFLSLFLVFDARDSIAENQGYRCSDLFGEEIEEILYFEERTLGNVRATDFNGNDENEVVVLHSSGPYLFSVWARLHTPDGTTEYVDVVKHPWPTRVPIRGWEELTVEDFDSDGRQDIVLYIRGSNIDDRVIFFRNIGNNQFGFPEFEYTQFIEFSHIGSIGFRRNNNRTELIVSEFTSFGQVYETFLSRYTYGPDGFEYSDKIVLEDNLSALLPEFSVVDLEQDGVDEIIVNRRDFITVLSWDPSRRISQPADIRIPNELAVGIKKFAVIQADSDSELEIVALSYSHELALIDRAHSSGKWEFEKTAQIDIDPDNNYDFVLRSSDLDRDGFDELVTVYNVDQKKSLMVFDVQRMTPRALKSYQGMSGVGSNFDIKDLDGDNYPEIILSRSDNFSRPYQQGFSIVENVCSEVGNSPVVDFKLNEKDSQVYLSRGDSVVANADFLAGSSQGMAIEYWVIAVSPFGILSLDETRGWEFGLVPYATEISTRFSERTIFTVNGLPSGEYSFYFVIDTVTDGIITWDKIHFDGVSVTAF